MKGLSVEVRDLHKQMKRTPALKGLSMTFRPECLHGIIGPEGAGKTTLMRHLMGLLRADRGNVRYVSAGKEIPYADLRETIAYMPQTQSLYPELSVHEHLEFFKTLYRLSEADYKMRREKLLEMSRLAPFTDRLASQLSGGMYKKLGLICSLLSSPRLLLLDEPTNGVDPLSRRDFWELLYQLRSEEGILILITTSYMDEALRCEEVHLLFEGRCLSEGAPQDLLRQEQCHSFDEVFLKHDLLEIP